MDRIVIGVIGTARANLVQVGPQAGGRRLE
ncbi:hypothetical protein GGD41_007836 [Paraburkholderia bryophila]|uniref:Uncharacterized protein n=1 Tax=Paraburkholderia bryophila TaxID=420952 RepID=A0A7Z0B431_9BURK|nr:hypothetical protein [Paraburkholderia bryophila]